MPHFRRIDARQAGPNALGILVPPGLRTVVILRPRALDCDLLPLQPGLEKLQPAVFCSFEREQAALVARQVHEALERCADRAPDPLDLVCVGAGDRFGVCARIESRLWIACRRAAGQAYQPAFYDTQEEAVLLAARLTAILWPTAEATQAFYFNTQAFSR
jgi:hypothetical protein